MHKLMDSLYDNIQDAKAFSLSFTNFAYTYDDCSVVDFETVICKTCKKAIQTRDFLCPKSSCKKPVSILDTYQFGISLELRDELISRFDISEADFRPIRNKSGEIVYYQITPRHIMLPIHEENNWIPKEKCPECGGVQYEFHHFKNQKNEFYFYISQAALDDLHDLNVTYEGFRWYRPEYIISRRVYDFLTERYPRTHYFPLFLNNQK